jgi:deoxycytidylate deaminase
MIKPDDPRTLALDLLARSECSVQVAAVLADKDGIFAWGWNHSGPTGYGIHAEHHAITRANKKRLEGSTIYVASRRMKSQNQILSRPCFDCEIMLKKHGIAHTVYTLANDSWRQESL